MNLELKRLAKPLKGLKVLHVNATKAGGGVAEILHSLVPSLNRLGVNADWFVPKLPQELFNTTKKFHNALQGVKQDISLDEIGFYLDTIRDIRLPDADLYFIHDPQILPIEIEGTPKIWRCHIQTQGYDTALMNILLPYINGYDSAVWTDPSFVPDRVKVPTYSINPVIDPQAIKNQLHTGQYAKAQLEIPPNVPIIAAVSRFDLHKNQERIIKAFQKLDIPDAMLVILGNFAADDPEGGALYSELREFRTNNIRIRAIDDARLVGSLMSIADVFVHTSTKEGFGLVVSEAMIQGTPVIGSDVGGIPKQVLHGYTGWLVDPEDIETTTRWMKHALTNADETRRLGNQAREWVLRNFTTHHLLRDHLTLYKTLV